MSGSEPTATVARLAIPVRGTPAGAPLLAVEEIHTYYGSSYVLQGVSLEVYPGEVVALLGRNGAGKTTTLRSIMRLTPPRRGRVLFDGRPIHTLPPHRLSRLGLALVPQGRGIFDDLTVRENLTLGARPGAWTVDRVVQLFPRLRERWGVHGLALSGGERQMLAIGRALLQAPRLLLMDEPSEGLAPRIVEQLGSVIARLKDEGLPILLVEQNLALALGLADRVYVLSKGQVVFSGTAAELWSDAELHRRYLGV